MQKSSIIFLKEKFIKPLRFSIALSIVGLLLLQSTDTFAGAAVVVRRRQAQMAQQQAMAQQEMQQQVMLQQYQAAQQQVMVQQEQQVYAQQMYARQQQQQQLQQQAIAQQMLIQVQQQQQQVYAQAVHKKQIEYANAQQAATVAAAAKQYQEAVIQEAVRQKVNLNAAQMAQIQQLALEQAQVAAVEARQVKKQIQAVETAQIAKTVAQNRPFEPVKSDVVQDVVDIAEVWRKLDVDSRCWSLLIDNQAKVDTVAEYIDRFRKQGVKIQGPSVDYVRMIDDMAMQNPAVLTWPFIQVVQLVAVMQYDFDNGMDKDALAQKLLGQQLYMANKKRFRR